MLMQENEPVESIPRGTPENFILDASVLDMQEGYEILREDIKRNSIEFVFPAGLNQVDLFDECRALTKLDDFDTIYDLTMSMLHGKPVVIRIKNADGSKNDLCAFQVVDKYMNLRGITVINEYPCLVTWLTEFIGAHILKKFPQPGKSLSQPQAAVSKGGKKKHREKATT